MSTFVLTDASILLGGVGVTDKSNQLTITYEVETQDNTVFGHDTRSNAAGLWVVSGEVGGFVDDQLEDDLWSKVGSGPDVFQAATPGDDGTIGYAFRSMLVAHTPLSGSVGEMAADSLSLSGKSGAPLVRGTILHPATAETSSGAGTERQLGAVGSSDEKVYGALNVTDVSGTTPTLDVTVESDDNSGFTSATTRLTFDQQTGVGADWQSAAGAITDDWWRVSFTIGGTSPSFTFQCLVGIR